MIYVSGNWEQVETKEDCLRVIREGLGVEFADIAEQIFTDVCTAANLKHILGNLSETADEIESMKKQVAAIEDNIDNAREYIREMLAEMT